MKQLFTIIALAGFVGLTFGQAGFPGQSDQESYKPIFANQQKAAGDSCGYYFNNYIGLEKTTNIYAEPMRVGNVSESGFYSGRAQRFTTSQPVEVSGIEFYGWVQNSAMDSIMVITKLFDYNAGPDTVGTLLAEDTVYVTHTAFSIVLPDIAVQSFFDTPVTVSSDYIISMETPTDDSLWIVTNDYFGPDGGGENQSHALYNNIFYPGFIGYYSVLNDLGYDYDYLMSPFVKFDLHDSFTILDDSICPGVIAAGCVDYVQVGNFSNPHYTGQNPTDHIGWLWGDGFQNTMISSACHTYNNPGTYNIELKDTLWRYDFNNPFCAFSVQQPIYVEDSVFADFTSSSSGLTADFVNTSTNADSVWWDFGDMTPGTNTDSPSHTYGSVGTYDVWIFAYNDCFEDSIMYQVTVDDVGLNDFELSFEVYPNPANNYVTIAGIPSGSQISIMNVLGQNVMDIRSSETTENIDLNELTTGSYFIQVTFEGYQTTQKLIVKH